MLMSSSRTLNVTNFFRSKTKYLEVLISHPNGMGKNLLLLSLYGETVAMRCRSLTVSMLTEKRYIYAGLVHI
jgi:hypothetical protein